MVPPHELALPVNFFCIWIDFRLLVHTFLNCNTDVSLSHSDQPAVQPQWEYMSVPSQLHNSCCLQCSARKGNCKCFCGCSLFYPAVLRVADTKFQGKECQCLPERALYYLSGSKILLPRLYLPVLCYSSLSNVLFSLLDKQICGAAQVYLILLSSYEASFSHWTVYMHLQSS